MGAAEAQRGAVTCPRSHSNRVKTAVSPGFSGAQARGPPQLPRESSWPTPSSPAASGLRLFVLPVWQPCPHPGLPCLNPRCQPPCQCLWYSPTPLRKARPGPGAALSRHLLKGHSDGHSKGPAWRGPATMGSLCPGCPPRPSPAPDPVPTLGAGISPHPHPGAGRGSPTWRGPGTGSAEFPGGEPGDLGGRNQTAGLPQAVTLQSPPPPRSQEGPGPPLQRGKLRRPGASGAGVALIITLRLRWHCLGARGAAFTPFARGRGRNAGR